MKSLEKKIIAGMTTGGIGQIELTRLIFENANHKSELTMQLASIVLNLIPYTGMPAIFYGIAVGGTIVTSYNRVKNRYKLD